MITSKEEIFNKVSSTIFLAFKLEDRGLLVSDSSLSGFAADCRDETREDLRRGEGEDDLRLFPVTSSKMEETRVFVRRSTLAVDVDVLPPLSS